MKNAFKKNCLAVVAILLLLPVIACGGISKDNPTTGVDVEWGFYNERAESFMAAISGGDFEAATAMFDETMSRALSIAGLESVWQEITGRAGGFIAIHGINNDALDGYYLADVTSKHEKAGVTLRIVFNKDGLVAGLFVVDYPVIENEDNREAVQREGFTDYPVIIGEGTDYPLRGILSMPDNTAGKIPAVVIVHGSGPQDMDMTLFGNKPYRDIAEYLASNGIAVIRYDKRTLTHGAKMDGSWTVWEETIEDALLAAEILRGDPRIDENRVFIIGHSLGGILAPRIQAEGGDFAGIIILAGSPRFLLDISKTQNYLTIEAMEEGDEKEAALASMEQWDDAYSYFLTLPDDEAKNTPVPGWGVSAYYFKDLYEKPIPAYIDNIRIPFFVLQGSNDFQILADVDFALYQELLTGRPYATLKLYAGLNHLFMPSTIESIADLMEEYAIENQVDRGVLADIVEWILALQ